MNKVILVGNLARDPELRQTPQGTSVTTFTVAVSRRYQKDAQQQQADFINCVAWGTTAEFVSRYFKKGKSMQLSGRLRVDSWEDQSGQKRYRTEVVAEDVEFNDSSRSQNNDGGSYYQGNNGGNSYQSRPAAPAPSAPAAPSAPSVNSDFAGDLDIMGFDDLDGSEDDLPF